jgi:hypothetical protein
MTTNQSSDGGKRGPVVVSAGRRVDAPGVAAPRFPPQNVPMVRARIQEYLQEHMPSAIVASAACGADLLLLQAAQNIPRYVLLPSEPEEFRKSSVTDRPGVWGAIYDEVLGVSEVEVLRLPDGQEGYLAINDRLLNRAQSLAGDIGTSVTALVIWNKQSRGHDDVTEHFRREAQKRELVVDEISTL